MSESTTVKEESEVKEEIVSESDNKKESDTKAVESAEKSAEVDQDLSKESKAILESIESMTVLELSKLVKALEDKFGVVAAAPMMAGPGVAAGAAGGDAEDTASATVDVVLTGCGDKKIQVLKAVRDLTGLGLKEAKDVVDNVPKVVKEGVTKEEAEEIKKKLEEQGAQVEIK